MTPFCTDRDLLLIEPGLFTSGAFPAQRLAAGADGALAGTTFSSDSANFFTAGVSTGMVLCVHFGQLSEGYAFEIVSADAYNSLTCSVPRADTIDSAIAPPLAATGLNWQIASYSPQIATVSANLAERLRSLDETAPIDPASFVDSSQLRIVAAYAALADILAASAQACDTNDVRWAKAQRFAELAKQALLRLRLDVDADGDGQADQTRSLANIRLRRR